MTEDARAAALTNLEMATKVFEESEPSYADGENMSLQAAHFWSHIYVGDQLARIADMIASGFWAEKGDFGGYTAGPQDRH